MAQENLTIFQRLGRIFGPEKIEKSNRYSIDNKELLKTTSQEEFNKVKLQSQQGLYLKNLWQRVDGEMYQNTMFYETTRIAAYADFENMEFYPEISAALDIMMEEATTTDSYGKILSVYSDSKRVKRILEDLFYNRLDIHTNLPMWTRNTCKYGDDFLFLNIDDEHGIIGARQLPNIEIERHEMDLHASILARNQSVNSPGRKDGLKFIWRGKDIEFHSWQIAHFRLLGDDRRLPYGTSMLEKARRIWKQLLLSEDAMLIYRITRAPERRIFKIFVGNIDDNDVPAYVDQIANRFKRTPVIDPKTGQVDVRYNQMAQDQDFFIPVRDPGAPSPIETLPGASNLSEIADIEYLQKKLFTALRIPKPFLGFDESAGDGKNLALQDIRFARTINRIQQSMLQELNKIAIIHLFILGLEDELDNFTLKLNNPSTQAEMLKVEHLQQKLQLYKDAVSDAGNGFAAMSMTKAKKEILNMSEDDIRLDIEQQRIEKAAAAELENTSKVIKQTGFFEKVDKLYGEFGTKPVDTGDGGEENADSGDAGGDFSGGGSFGGGGGAFGDLGDIDTGDGEETEGEEGAEGEGDETTEPFADIEPTETGAEGGNEEPKGESILGKTDKLLTEQKEKLHQRIERNREIYTKKLIESIVPKDELKESRSKVYKNNLIINEDIDSMVRDINKLIKE